MKKNLPKDLSSTSCASVERNDKNHIKAYIIIFLLSLCILLGVILFFIFNNVYALWITVISTIGIFGLVVLGRWKTIHDYKESDCNKFYPWNNEK